MYVFVYGTLRRGQGNNRLLTNATLIGYGQINGVIADLGGCPALIELGGKGVVHGEVYEVDRAILESLDRLEGYRGPTSKENFYDRVSVAVTFKSSALNNGHLILDHECWAYAMNGKRDRTYNVIPHGDWVRHTQERRA